MTAANPSAVAAVSRAQERARERGEKLDDVLIATLTKYAERPQDIDADRLRRKD